MSKPMVKVVATSDRVVDEHRLDEVNQLRWLPVGEARLVPRSATTRKALKRGKQMLPLDEETAKWGACAPGALAKGLAAIAAKPAEEDKSSTKKGAGK